MACGRWLLGLCLAALMVSNIQAAQPVQARTANPIQPAAQPPASPDQAPMVFIKSEFDADAGKDPFFPDSIRHQGGKGPSVDWSDLKIKGISIGLQRRLVMINNVTLAVGEEADIKAGSTVYKVRCMEIREKSAVINYRGVTKEIFLQEDY